MGFGGVGGGRKMFVPNFAVGGTETEKWHNLSKKSNFPASQDGKNPDFRKKPDFPAPGRGKCHFRARAGGPYQIPVEFSVFFSKKPDFPAPGPGKVRIFEKNS